MQLHLEGPTGPHGEIKLPNMSGNEREPILPDNSAAELDSEIKTDTAKSAYIN